MRELPIIYSAPMVLAKLAGRKTMTRRTAGLKLINSEPEHWEFVRLEVGNVIQGPTRVFALFRFIDGKEVWLPCPYGQPGDVLYARENLNQWATKILYHADGSVWTDAGDYHYRHEEYIGAVPCIHMPKVAARIWDEVVSIRVERAQDINYSDCIAEGVQIRQMSLFGLDNVGRDKVAKTHFEFLWTSINGAESWNQNPFVWVVSTKNLSLTGKPASLCSQSK